MYRSGAGVLEFQLTTVNITTLSALVALVRVDPFLRVRFAGVLVLERELRSGVCRDEGCLVEAACGAARGDRARARGPQS